MPEELKLRLQDVSKSFSRVDSDIVTSAVADINMEMNSHEFISIVGPSGCGKSTILRLIAGLVEPTTGEITMDGEKITGPGPRVGMVFQKPTLFPWLTVKDNIGFSLSVTGKLRANEEAVQRMIHIIGLDQFENDFPGQLSGGMAQRVALARAMISRPEILLMDEPLGALDAFTRMNMQKEILDMWRIDRQLVIMVTHDIDEAVYMSTRIFVMDGKPGRISREIPIPMEYPRRRSSGEFVKFRNEILSLMSFDINE